MDQHQKVDLYVIVVGLVFHLVLAFSIVDIYFKSPLVHGMQPVERLSKQPPLAKRLVLVVADGLRADSFYNLVNTDSKTFFRKKKENVPFAISHTRVPTESRPGHVAMIGGFYEDLSAVTKGWKENPVEFDSVFNQSRYTWGWGSPDVLHLFKSSERNVFLYTYDANTEDFATQNASMLDLWVLHNFKKFIYHSQVNRTETNMLHQDSVVFFFHLLGLDTHGHSKKPHSKEYIQNIVVVDKIVEEIEHILADYYLEDNRTAFVFTADHGMTDWGSHGSGDDSETLTPFVAWGSGIATPGENDKQLHFEQADIAPLMSYLIGLPIPLNSIGKMPINLLNLTDFEKCLALKTNVLQIIEQLKIKYQQTKKSAIFFKEFEDLTMLDITLKLTTIETLLLSKKYEQAIDSLNHLIDLSLLALDYYHKYNKFYLGCCIILSCLGWITYLLMYKLSSHTMLEHQRRRNRWLPSKKTVDIIFVIALVVTIILAKIKYFQFTFYIYSVMPLFLWRSVFVKGNCFEFCYSLWAKNKLKNTLYALALLLSIQTIVLSFFYRWVFSLYLIVYAVYLSMSLRVLPNQFSMKWTVVVSSILISVFPLLPVIAGHTHFYLVYISLFFSNMVYFYLYKNLDILQKSNVNSSIVLLLNVLSFANIVFVRKSIEYELGLPSMSQLFSYLVMASCLIVPIATSALLKKRLVVILFCLLNLYFHLSISYESAFIVSLCLQLVFWLHIESFKYCGHFSMDFALNKKRISQFVSTEEHEFESMNWSNAFRVFTLTFYLFFAFFGTGNVASINSYDPASVFCFVTVFNPFLMGFLIFIKIAIPFLIVIVVFHCIHEVIDSSLKSSFVFLMIICDIMALHFLFLVKTDGSWRDIGTSISHYIVALLVIIFASLFFSFVNFLFKFELFNSNSILRSIKTRFVKYD